MLKLKRARERRGITQVELARRVGAHPISIARLEIGTRRPSLGLLERLAKALKVKVGELLE